MRLNLRNGVLIGATALMLSSCGVAGIGGKKHRLEKPPVAMPDGQTKIGQPYEVAGEAYNPADNVQYDEVGYASWYGDELRGNPTSNGEPFNPDGISAAHATLPMPSYVEVTRLDSGKTILVRVNDRGPFAKNRIIDLSRGAAQQLGIEAQGNVAVRVRRVNPPDQEKTVLRMGQRAAERIETPEPLLVALRRKLGSAPSAAIAAAPSPVAPRPVPPKPARAVPVGRPGANYDPPVATQPSGGDRFVIEDGSGRSAPRAAPAPRQSEGYFIQVGAFSSQARAQALANQVGARAEQAGNVWRVRKGPYADEASARAPT
jgi:rare lipoprotein A